MMHTIAGGAAARPFRTHHNALDIGLSLRIAPELYLKRLVVGGLDRVYEINRNFRNEGVSTQHNPEFTMLEFYQAYANYHDLMDLTQELITLVAKEVNGTTITNFNGHEIDLSKWQKLSMREAIIKFWPAESQAPALTDFHSTAQLAARLRAASREMKAHRGKSGDIQTADSIEDSKPSTSQDANVPGSQISKCTSKRWPTTSTNAAPPRTWARSSPRSSNLWPKSTSSSPPSSTTSRSPSRRSRKVKPDEPDWVERFEFYIGGFEVGNAFSELNDPDDQRRRFEDQLKERDRGDDEAHQMDEDYVRALGFGLPPTAGEGIGIDRLTMILTGSRSIRDVILFPLMRPLTKTPADEADDEHTHGESAE